MNGNGGTTATGNGAYSGQRIFTLLGNLREDFTDMLKRELDLFKAELGEKVSSIGKQGGMVAAGGMIAYTGAIFIMIGLCALIAWALTKAGLSTGMAVWIAFLAFGAIVAVTGFLLLKSGLKKLSQTSMSPNETIATVKEFARQDTNIATGIVGSADIKNEKSKKTREARYRAEQKMADVQTELAEIQARLKPQYMWAATCTAVKRRPQLSAGIGAAVIALGYLMTRKRRRTKRANQEYQLVLD